MISISNAMLTIESMIGPGNSMKNIIQLTASDFMSASIGGVGQEPIPNGPQETYVIDLDGVREMVQLRLGFLLTKAGAGSSAKLIAFSELGTKLDDAITNICVAVISGLSAVDPYGNMVQPNYAQPYVTGNQKTQTQQGFVVVFQELVELAVQKDLPLISFYKEASSYSWAELFLLMLFSDMETAILETLNQSTGHRVVCANNLMRIDRLSNFSKTSLCITLSNNK